jgi:hypothetical protein
MPASRYAAGARQACEATSRQPQRVAACRSCTCGWSPCFCSSSTARASSTRTTPAGTSCWPSGGTRATTSWCAQPGHTGGAHTAHCTWHSAAQHGTPLHTGAQHGDVQRCRATGCSRAYPTNIRAGLQPASHITALQNAAHHSGSEQRSACCSRKGAALHGAAGHIPPRAQQSLLARPNIALQRKAGLTTAGTGRIQAGRSTKQHSGPSHSTPHCPRRAHHRHFKSSCVESHHARRGQPPGKLHAAPPHHDMQGGGLLTRLGGVLHAGGVRDGVHLLGVAGQ